jgi:hypothetical protein
MLKKMLILAAVLLVALAVMMLSTRAATFSVGNTLAIEHPVSPVWQALVAVEEWPAWWPGMESAALAPEWREGAVLNLRLKGTPEKSGARVASVLFEKELVWERDGILGSVTATTLRLDPISGGVLVTLESSIRGPQAFLARFTGDEEFGKYHHRVLAALDAHLKKAPLPGRKGEI